MGWSWIIIGDVGIVHRHVGQAEREQDRSEHRRQHLSQLLKAQRTGASTIRHHASIASTLSLLFS